MTLQQVLNVLPYDTPVGIWNIDAYGTRSSKHKLGNCPSPQQYQKVGNLPYIKIRNFLDYDVLNIYPLKEQFGVLIKIRMMDKVRTSLDHYDLACKIANEFKRSMC